MLVKLIFCVFIIMVIFLLVILLVWSLWQYYMYFFWICDGCVCVDVVNIVFDVLGQVVVLLVCDNQLVKKGDLLMEIDLVCYILVLQQVEVVVMVCKVDLDVCKVEVEVCCVDLNMC